MQNGTRRPPTQARRLRLWVCLCCQNLHPPSPFIIITEPESWYSFYRPTECRRLRWPSWLVNIPRWFTHPQTVTHPGTNRVWRSATTLIKANALPLSQSVNIYRQRIVEKKCYRFLSKHFFDKFHESVQLLRIFFVCCVDWPTGIDLARSDMHGLRDIIVVAAYIIGGTVCFVLIIAIILTAIQRALLLRQARARACRDSGSRRQLVREHDSSRGPRSGGNVAADLPPSYDVVMCSPDQHAPRSAGVQPSGPVVSSASPAVTSPTSQLLTTDDVIRPPSYDDVLHQNISAK